jgi:hypothetical protein
MGEKWPGIIGWFVTIKCWIIVVYSKDWVSWNCSHEEEEMMTIIGSFLDGISWRSCREIIFHEIWCGCCYFDLECELCFSSKVSRRKRRMRYTGRRNDQLISHESEEKGIAIWRDGLWFQLGRNFINLCKPFWMNVERRKFFWITLFRNVSQLKWIILKEPFEDRKYLGTHFKYKIKITLG